MKSNQICACCCLNVKLTAAARRVSASEDGVGGGWASSGGAHCKKIPRLNKVVSLSQPGRWHKIKQVCSFTCLMNIHGALNKGRVSPRRGRHSAAWLETPHANVFLQRWFYCWLSAVCLAGGCCSCLQTLFDLLWLVSAPRHCSLTLITRISLPPHSAKRQGGATFTPFLSASDKSLEVIRSFG